MLTHSAFSVTAQDTMEKKQNEVYRVSTDGIETTPNVVYGAAFDPGTKVFRSPSLPHVYEDINIS